MAVNQKRGGGTAARTAAGSRQDANSRHDGGEHMQGQDAPATFNPQVVLGSWKLVRVFMIRRSALPCRRGRSRC